MYYHKIWILYKLISLNKSNQVNIIEVSSINDEIIKVGAAKAILEN